MSNGIDGLNKLGGISFIASGALFLVTSVLDLMTGPPPSAGTEILAWRVSHELLMAVTPEVLFFAVMLLVPAVIALHQSLAVTHRRSAAVGCGILAVTIPVLNVLLIVFGRLVYPVYHLKVRTPEAAELVVTLYYGGLHVVLLLFAVATLVLSLAMRRTAFGRKVASLGFATAALDVVASYPWLIGPALGLVCGIFFSAWLVAVGFRLHRIPAAMPS